MTGAGSEIDLLAWLAEQPETAGLLGDDTARLPDPGPRTITVDSQIEGVHFPAGDVVPPEAVARRLLAVNVSDLAAAGARPSHAFLALSAPPGFPHRRFFRAFLTACRSWGVTLAGGDLTTPPDRLTATLTLLGDPPSGGAPLGRRAGTAGHGIWVSGELGESALGQRILARGATVRERDEDGLPGLEVTSLPPAVAAAPEPLREAARRAVLRHLEPEPQLELGLALGQLPPSRRGAVLDVSDGLALDLKRLCARSRVGGAVCYEDLPRPDRLDELCTALGLDPAGLLLGGGEDYQLLFTLPDGQRPPAGHPGHCIGRLTEGSELVLEREGARRPWPEIGWDHLSERDEKPEGKGESGGNR